MAELALRTTEFRNQKSKYLAWRPVGSVVEVIDAHRLRLKWLEIVCDLVSEKKRQKYKGIPGWKTLCDHWTQQLWETWWQAGRPTEKHPHGRLLEDPAYAESLWGEVVDSQVPDLLGKDPRGEVDLVNTWLWSEYERRNWFIVVNGDEDLEKVKAWNGKQESFVDGDLIIHPKTRIKYDSDLSLSSESLSTINDKETIVHPKFSAPVSKTVVSTPDTKEATK